MKNFKKMLALVIALCVTVGVLAVTSFAADAELGSYENPYQLATGGRTAVNVTAGASAYVKVDDANGTIVKAYGVDADGNPSAEGWFIQYGRMPSYADANAELSFEMATMGGDIFSVANTSETASYTVYLQLEAPAASTGGTGYYGVDGFLATGDGSWGNPYVLDQMDYVNYLTKVDAGASDVYYHIFTAPADGTVAVTMYGGSWQYRVNCADQNIYGDMYTYDAAEPVSYTEQAVAAGDVVEIFVSTYDPANWYACPAGEIDWAVQFAATPGSQNNPHSLSPYNMGGNTFTVAAGETAYANLYNYQGSSLKFTGTGDYTFTLNGTQITPVDGVVSTELADAMYLPCIITNNTNAEQTYTAEFVYPAGSSNNPEVLENGSYTVEMTVDSTDCHYYTFTAPAHGTAVVTIDTENSGASWEYQLNKVPADPDNYAGYVYGDPHCSSDAELVTSSEMQLEAGETINLTVGTEYSFDTWSYAAGKVVWNFTFTAHPNLVHFEAVTPGCHSNGNIEYWFCPDCEGFWQDAELTQLTNSKNVNLPATGSENVVHVEAVAAGCHSNGNIEYWFCPDCEGFWQDEALTQVTNSKNVNLPATGSENVVHVEAVAPGCHSNGNIEYWFCPDCEGFWQDEALTQVTNSKNVILPATGSENVEHYEAAAATCHGRGNIEYWYCPDCEGFWQDEALTQVTNSKNVYLPELGSENMVHFEAVAPTCHGLGNIEYWYCADCGGYWQNEACTQLTNSKNVILPELGSDKVKHVEAVAATTEAEGNIEYWHCEECGMYWQDEALTQVTNVKRVITPKLETPATGDATPVAALVILAVAATMGLALVVVNKKKFNF